MPDAHKQRLVELCSRFELPIIEDDTYSALCDDGVPLKAVKAWDRDGGVIYCASLRKTLAPGLRLGWVAGGRWHARIQMLKYAQSRANEVLSQITAAEFIGSSAYDRHLARLRRLLKTQREQTAECIGASFPEGTRFNVPAGSLLLWVQLPEGCEAQRVSDAALERGIRVVPGPLFSNSKRYDNCLRISSGFPVTAESLQALGELGRIAAAV